MVCHGNSGGKATYIIQHVQVFEDLTISWEPHPHRGVPRSDPPLGALTIVGVTPTSIVREMYSTTNSNTRGNIYQVMADLAQEVCYADDFCTEKTVEYEVVSVTPKDNTLYETLLSKFKQEYSTRVVKNARFIHFLKWLTQAAHNPSLLPLIRYGTLITAAASQLNLERFTQKLGDNGFDDSVKTVLASIQKGEELCSVCMDVIDRPTITPCKHVFCHECIHRWITKRDFVVSVAKRFSLASSESWWTSLLKKKWMMTPSTSARSR